jgi:prepilin peptidase CpaA
LSRLVFDLLLFGAVAMDLRYRKIPNWITLPGIVLGLAFNLGWLALIGALTGAIAGAIMMDRAHVGAGDMKLLAMIGAFLGPAGVAAACWMAVLTWPITREISRPLAPALALGAILWLWIG